MIDHKSPQYWPSKIFPEITSYSFLCRIPFALIEWYVSTLNGFVAVFVVLTAILHVHVLTEWTQFIW
jgi:hypothetical protein